MNYVKSCLIITMLLGGLFADDCASNDDLGTEGGCGDGMYCGACCDVDGVNYFMCSSQQQPTCEYGGGTWNGVEECETAPDYCDPEQYNCDCNEDTWREYYNSEGQNMEGCWLQGADLSGQGADLEITNLENANLSGAFLVGANLEEANLSFATLSYATLSFANLDGADLGGADLTNTSCWGAFFVGAILDGTIFDGANLTYAYFDENEDEYDDVSYEAGAESGDLNLDGIDNVLDVVILVDNILNP